LPVVKAVRAFVVRGGVVCKALLRSGDGGNGFLADLTSALALGVPLPGGQEAPQGHDEEGAQPPLLRVCNAKGASRSSFIMNSCSASSAS
jgi:hypothetical protein